MCIYFRVFGGKIHGLQRLILRKYCVPAVDNNGDVLPHNKDRCPACSCRTACFIYKRNKKSLREFGFH